MGEDDLDSFRTHWLQELNKEDETHAIGIAKDNINKTTNAIAIKQESTKTGQDPLEHIVVKMQTMSINDKMDEAMKIYEQGLHFENLEQFQESIKYYRIAHKLDAFVDKRYRDTYSKRANAIDKSSAATHINKSESSFVRVVQESDLLKLPSELLLKIMKLFVPYELNILYNLSLTNRLFSELVNHSSIWAKAFRCISNDASTDLDYKLLFQTTPHVRYDGIYISVCRYIRAGLAADSINAPVHIVQYYRYIRFYSDGTCFVKLSNDHPSKVVVSLSSDNLRKNGNWQLNELLTISFEDNELFTMTFNLKRIRKRFNKLEWVDYICHTITEDYSISLHNERSFKFAKVMSIVKQLY